MVDIDKNTLGVSPSFSYLEYPSLSLILTPSYGTGLNTTWNLLVDDSPLCMNFHSTHELVPCLNWSLHLYNPQVIVVFFLCILVVVLLFLYLYCHSLPICSHNTIVLPLCQHLKIWIYLNLHHFRFLLFNLHYLLTLLWLVTFLSASVSNIITSSFSGWNPFIEITWYTIQHLSSAKLNFPW